MGSSLSKTNKSNPYTTELHGVENHKNGSSAESIHKGSILGISNSGISDQIITCSDDKTISIFKYGYDFSPTETHKNILKSASNNDKVSKPKIIQDIKFFEGHTKAVNKVLFVGNDTIWTASRDLSLKRWKVDTNECMQTIENAHNLNISAIATNYQPNHHCNGSAHNSGPTYLFSGSRDYSVKCWDINYINTTNNTATTTSGTVNTATNTLSSPTCLMEFSAPRNIVTAMLIEPTSQQLLYQCSEDLFIRVWDIRMNNNSGNSSNTNSLSANPSSSSSSSHMYQKNVKTPAMCVQGFIYFPLCLDLHSNGYLLATGCKGIDGVGGEVKLFDTRYLSNKSNLTDNNNRHVSNNNQSNNYTTPVAEFKGHQHDVTGCYFSTDSSSSSSSSSSSHIVTVSKDGKAYAWNYHHDDRSVGEGMKHQTNQNTSNIDRGNIAVNINCNSNSSSSSSTASVNNDCGGSSSVSVTNNTTGSNNSSSSSQHHLCVNSLDKYFTCISKASSSSSPSSSSDTAVDMNANVFYVGAFDGSVSILQLSKSSSNYNHHGDNNHNKTKTTPSSSSSSSITIDGNDDYCLTLQEISPPYIHQDA